MGRRRAARRGRAAGALGAALVASGVEPGPHLRVHLLNDDPVHALTTAARGAELLVVGEPGDGRSRRVGQPSIADSCRRHGGCPVLEVPVHGRPVPRRT